MTKKQETAFPATEYPMGKASDCSPGLTKREYFAALALQGLLANPENLKLGRRVSRIAVEYADNLIEELNK